MNYSAGSLPLDQDINIPNLTIDPEDMIPANFFTPGMGVPLALLTNRAAIITVDRWFMNEQLKFSITSMLDLGDYIGVSGITGSLTEYKIEYNNVLIIEKGSYTYTVCFQPNQFADFIYFVN